jgi:hypothetical protein
MQDLQSENPTIQRRRGGRAQPVVNRGPVESAAATMDDASIFLYDLQGYIVIRGVLSPEQVLAANRSTGALG